MVWDEMYALPELGPLNNPYFWSDVDADGVPKPVGWAFLDAEGNLDNEDEDEEGEGGGGGVEDGDSEFEEQSEEEESEEESSDDDEESYADDDESSDDDEEEEEEEEGEDWDELERKAAASDKVKRSWEQDDEPRQKSKKSRH